MSTKKNDWIVMKDGSEKHVKCGDKIGLQNVSCHKFIAYTERGPGIVNLGWKDAVSSWNIKVISKKPEGTKILSGDNVALKMDVANKFLVYQTRSLDTINLGWSETPVFQWKLEAEGADVLDEMPIAFFNEHEKDYLVYHPRTFGINVMWIKDTSSKKAQISEIASKGKAAYFEAKKVVDAVI